MASLIQKHAHVKGQRSNRHIFKFQPDPPWAKKRPNRYTFFPEDWTLATIIPIPKPGKDPGEPNNYRPIALTSCLCKTLERR